MNKWMQPLQAVLLGAKVLGFTDAPWAQIFLPTVYVLRERRYIDNQERLAERRNREAR